MKRNIILWVLCCVFFIPSVWGQSDTAVNMNNYIKLWVKNPGDTVLVYLSGSRPYERRRDGWGFRRPIRVEYNGRVIQRLLSSHIYRLERRPPLDADSFKGRVVCFGVDSTVTIYGDVGNIAFDVLPLDFLGPEPFAWEDGGLSASSIVNRKIKRIEIHSDTLHQLFCDSMGVEELRFYAPALRQLWCSENLLTSLDVSEQRKLTLLYCPDNQLTSLDLCNSISIDWLEAKNNMLESLCLPTPWCRLRVLNLDNNHLTHLDLSGCVNLEKFTCSYNQLVALDLSHCNDWFLDPIICNNNRLESITFGNSVNTIKAYCHNNKLRSINIPNGRVVSYLTAYNNLLSACALDSLFNNLGPGIHTILLHSEKNGEALSNPGAFTCRDYIARDKGYAVLKREWIDSAYRYESIVNTDYACAVGVEELMGGTVQVKAYPNPVQDRLYLETDRPIQNIEVFDMTGRLLSLTFHGNNFIDCASWHAGIYLLKITTDQGIDAFKITKQ